MKILFLTRTFPPVVGGMENVCFELSVHLPKFAQVKTIANRRGKKFLPVFLPLAVLKALYLAPKYDVLLLGDGVMAVVGWFVKIFLGKRKKVVSVVHGLDITYQMPLFQKLWVGKFLPALDKLIAVGNETIRQGVARGIAEEKFVFVPNGIDTEKFIGDYSRGDLEKAAGIGLEGKKVILTSGRLAKRKGVAWFVRKVVPKLSENVVYIVAGDGPDKESIEKAIKDNRLEERVRMLGFVSDETRNILFNTCDIFVQPNIKVPGDMEGFGITMIEATTCRLPVVASGIEGIKDAIKDGQNGFLLESGNAQAYAAKITELLADGDALKKFGENAREYAIENYSWDKIAKKYIEEIKRVVGNP